jgi:hypothetical protein
VYRRLKSLSIRENFAVFPEDRRAWRGLVRWRRSPSPRRHGVVREIAWPFKSAVLLELLRHRPRAAKHKSARNEIVDLNSASSIESRWGNEPVFAASYARRRSLEIDPVTFACRVAFFQDSTWFAGVWELTM